jgi:hypothetical protein
MHFIAWKNPECWKDRYPYVYWLEFITPWNQSVIVRRLLKSIVPFSRASTEGKRKKV